MMYDGVTSLSYLFIMGLSFPLIFGNSSYIYLEIVFFPLVDVQVVHT